MKLNLHPFMHSAGLSQTDLATSAGLSKGYVSEIMSGKKTPSPDVIARFAAILGVEAGALLTDSIAPDPAHGLAEPAAAFIFPEAVAIPIASGMAQAIAAVAPGLRHNAVWKAIKTQAGFGILAGDLLIIDLGAGPRAGDLVLATPEDPDSVTLLRRWAGSWLLPETPADAPISSTRAVAILGVVRGVLRGPAV